MPRALVVVGALVLLAGAVLAARGIRALPEVRAFLADYPGFSPLPDGTPVGFPAWSGWQHFLNSFLLLLIVRTGWELRKKQRPVNFYTRHNDGLLRTRNPPVRIGVPLWFHLALDALWILNGALFYVLLFATGQWKRLVPVSWDIIPNAISAGLQYVSLDWPTENSWVHYNALQLLSYFATVFIAAPLAIVTGVRLAPGLARVLCRFDRLFPLAAARVVHVWVMVYFIAFTIVHVTLVFATGALRNLNHMYAGRDDESWWGAAIFAASIVVTMLGWFAARPLVLRWLAGLTGTVR